MKSKKIALYMRLSQEDKDVDNNLKSESNSITNQRALLWQYIKNHSEFSNQDVEEYIDDGFTGTNFDRPKFHELIAAVMYGNISCVIVKDFSRLGRNYLETGNYLEKVFPMCQVRFISINDFFDSSSFKGETGVLTLEVKNLMNALYSRDISQKVTSAMNIRAAEGQYMAAFTPYGYIKDPSDKHRLIIDEVAAAVVREIFQWAADGVKKGDIAKRLNDRGEPTIIEHMNMVGVNKRSFRPKEKKLWSITTIRDTLKNEVYIGTTVWNKTRRVTTGSTRCVKNPKSEWQRIENTHLIEDYELQTKRLERVNDLIKELCQQIRYADKLLEIKGIGITTVAGFIAEVGDIMRFDSTKELQKLAGLELVADSSGKHNGKTKISKRGRKRLRYLLFEAAISVVGKNEEFKEIHRYYTIREKNPLKKMQSLIAVACKLIRVFHVILTKGVSYDASKMLEDIRHPGEQLKAA